jgi:hypothetical protein
MGNMIGLRSSCPAYYRIYVQGVVEPGWFEEYTDMRMAQIEFSSNLSMTIFAGELVDQSALLGVLNLIGDLGLPLLAFDCFPYREE